MSRPPITTEPLVIVLSGPGGVGKGTIANALVKRDPLLWLSRSWTTRPQRPGEPDDAYVFAARAEFEQRRDAGGFFEWTEFLGNYYGTPTDPPPPPGRDWFLEIEVDGARQVRAKRADAVLLFVVPPSRDEQARRLRGRGDPPEKVAARVRKAEEEEPIGRAIADHVIVNDDLDRAVSEIVELIEKHRHAR